MNSIIAVTATAQWFCLAAASADNHDLRQLKEKTTKRPMKKMKKPKTTKAKKVKAKKRKTSKRPKKPKKHAKTQKPVKKTVKKSTKPTKKPIKSSKSASVVHGKKHVSNAQTTILPATTSNSANLLSVNAKSSVASINSAHPTSKSDSSMATGTLVGIICAAVGVLALTAVVAMYVVRKHRKNKQRHIKSVLENDFEDFEDHGAGNHKTPYHYDSKAATSGGVVPFPNPKDMEEGRASQAGRWTSELVTEELQQTRRDSELSKSVVSVNDTILLRGTSEKNVLSSLVDMESDDESSDDDSSDESIESPPPRGLAPPRQSVSKSSDFEFAELHDSDDEQDRKIKKKEEFL